MVAVYEPSADLDYRLVRNTFVTMFYDPSVLARATNWLAEHGYQLVAINAHAWANSNDMHRDISQALNFPDYYGNNLDALNDCLSDVVSHSVNPQATGLVLVLTRYEVFAAREPATAHAVLDIVATQARNAALVGHRVICLVQSDDPQLSFLPVGATPIMWNDTEWLDSKRRPRIP
jgi:hypothetical protein